MKDYTAKSDEPGHVLVKLPTAEIGMTTEQARVLGESLLLEVAGDVNQWPKYVEESLRNLHDRHVLLRETVKILSDENNKITAWMHEERVREEWDRGWAGRVVRGVDAVAAVLLFFWLFWVLEKAVELLNGGG